VGRALARRDVWLLATGTDEALPDGFTVPFERTAQYFQMRWKAAFYVRADATLSPAEDLVEVRRLAAAIACSDHE
jgi:hypothetical protein